MRTRNKCGRDRTQFDPGSGPSADTALVSEAIYCRYGAVYKAKICDPFSRLIVNWLHMLHCTVVITLGNLVSFPSYVLLPCAYDIYYDYADLLLISLLLHALINATCAGTRLYR